MVKIVIAGIFSTLYTKCDNDSCMQKTVKIPGIPGKKIQIDELTSSMCVASRGTTATAWVTTSINGALTTLANWTEDNINYKTKNATPGAVSEVGESLTLSWNIKTSNAAVRAKMKDLTYSYTLLDIEAASDEYLVVVKCETQEEADALAANLFSKGANVYTKTPN
jgi:hypothetical protein